MPICASEIEGNLLYDCNAPLTKGNTETAYLGSLAHVTGSVIAPDGVTLTAFTLAPGKKLVKLEGYNLSNQTTLGYNKTDFAKFIPHSFIFRVLNNAAQTKQNINRLLANSGYFAIVQKKGRNGIFEVLGFNTGLDTDAFSADSNADDNGAYNFTLTAPEETSLPYTLIHTESSVVNTKAWLETLVFS